MMAGRGLSLRCKHWSSYRANESLTDRFSDYPEDQFRRMKFEHSVYGLLDLTERDTCLYASIFPQGSARD